MLPEAISLLSILTLFLRLLIEVSEESVKLNKSDTIVIHTNDNRLITN